MAISIKEAKLIALGEDSRYDRCDESPNYYRFYTFSCNIQFLFVEKSTGRIADSKEFYKDFFYDFTLRWYDLTKADEIKHEVIYEYYPDLNAVTKADGCTFFDTERGFIFDFDGDCFFDNEKKEILKSTVISSDEAYKIVSGDDYEFRFFGAWMSESDREHFRSFGMPYRLRRG